MPLATLSSVLDLATRQSACAIGFVCLGWEDAQAYVEAGEALDAPVILSAGPGARAHMPAKIWAEMFRTLAERATCPVVAHLDHGRSLEECLQGIDAGFNSIMFDGSMLALEENIRQTQEVVKAARAQSCSIEAELGIVGYDQGAASQGTEAFEVRAFLDAVDVDALAVSIGNVHLQRKKETKIDWARAAQIAKVARVPLVIHGGSGVALEDRRRLMKDFNMRKINLGTEFRQEYGRSLRGILAEKPDIFDRIQISNAQKAALVSLARETFSALGWSSN